MTLWQSTSHFFIFEIGSTIPGEYIEIGYVEAKGGLGVSKETLLEDMKEQAMKIGADALIKIDFYDRERYDRYIGGYDKPAAKAVMIRYKQKKVSANAPAYLFATKDTSMQVYPSSRRAIIQFTEGTFNATIMGESKDSYLLIIDGQYSSIFVKKNHVLGIRWLN